MKQTERLKHIYLQLNELPQTIESLHKYFSDLKIAVSKRQLYRDLADVKDSLLRSGETLEQRTGDFNRMNLSINRGTLAQKITDYDIDTYLIGRATIPKSLSNGRKDSLQKILSLLSDNLSNSRIEQNGNWDASSLANTHFYEVPYDEAFQKRLDKILWATANHRSITIQECTGDSVSLYKSTNFPFVYHPLKIIYHRGSFFVAGWVPSSKHFLTLDIYQITEFKVRNETFAFKKQRKQIEEDLNKRFGITQNIDDQIHQIVLEFSSGTGKFVEQHVWHQSQVRKHLPNGNLEFSLTCGINRELLGWIFQWMGNVKIIKPEILKIYYNEQLRKMSDLQNGAELTYSNIFQPE